MSASNDTLFVHNGPLTQAAIDFDQIESFVWRHNLEGLGHRGERLWIVLDDGQMCPTPVVTATDGLYQTGVPMTAAKAEAFVAELEERRRRAVN